MKPRISVLTLGVSDLEKSLAFFNMHDGLILALDPKAALAKDGKVSVTPPSPAELSIGHMVSSKREVDAVMARAEKAGATTTSLAHDRFWAGYSGYFQDLEGHLWEIVWNPSLAIKKTKRMESQT